MSQTRHSQQPPTDPQLTGLIHSEGAQPLHAAASDLLRTRIESGRWPPHYKLRAEPELAEELGVSRGTLRRAIQTLVDEGRLARTHGRGTFVAAREPEPAIAQQLLSLSEALAQDGVSVRVDVLESSVATPPSHVRGLLDLDERQPSLRLTRRYLTIDRPVAYLVNYVRSDRCPGIEQIDFAHKSLFGTLEGEYGLELSYGRRTFSAQGATSEAAEALGITTGSPILYLEQVTYLADGTPVEYSDVWIRSDRLKLSSLLTREQPPRLPAPGAANPDARP